MRRLIYSLADLAGWANKRISVMRNERRWDTLRRRGMHIGQGVNMPASTFVDTSHCFLIRIGDWCGFGEDCVILAHDGQFDEFLDAGRIGRVIIHDHSHIGARSIVLAGVEIGPRTLVGAGSVVTRSLPPDTVCAGNPAKVICSLEEYLDRHREAMKARPCFPYGKYDIDVLSPERRAELVAAVAEGDAYLTGGFTETLEGRGGMRVTRFDRGAFERPSSET